VLKGRKDEFRTNQTIGAEGMANFKLGKHMLEWFDNPSQVYLNFSEYLTYIANTRRDICNDSEVANDVPMKPRPNVWTYKYVSPT